MDRDFEHKDIRFHLNDNNHRNEYEGKYKLVFYHEGYERWQSIGTVNTKREALERIKYKAKHHIYPFCY